MCRFTRVDRLTTIKLNEIRQINLNSEVKWRRLSRRGVGLGVGRSAVIFQAKYICRFRLPKTICQGKSGFDITPIILVDSHIFNPSPSSNSPSLLSISTIL